MTKDYLNGLNTEQLNAVKTTEGYVRVIAGAGSGKTKALTCRYAYLVDTLDISPNRILSVTFTNKAANEMKERILSLIGDVPTPYIMTFHSFCNRFLHSEIEALGFSTSFKILDVDDQADILRIVYSELDLSPKEIPYKRALDEIIGAGCKNGPRSLVGNYEELLEKYSSYELHQLMKLAPKIEQKIIYGYLREQKRDACLDYEDLLNFALYLLKTRPKVRETWNNVFDYIQVDEFQDVSLREVELVGILSENCGNLFVVGDDSQCLIEGTQILTKNRGYVSVENITLKDKVIAGVGCSNVDTFDILNIHKKEVSTEVIIVKTKSGKIITATPEHKIFVNTAKSMYLHRVGIDLRLFVEKDSECNTPKYLCQINNISDKDLGIESPKLFDSYATAYIYAKDMIKHGITSYETIEVNAAFTSKSFSLMSFEDLQVGFIIPVYVNDSILDDTIIGISTQSYKGIVYDLDIDNVHNFIANDILVHNCIYGFRGADVNCIVEFEEIMNKVQNKQNTVQSIYLTKNYRSSKEILDVSNSLIKHNINRLDKDLESVKGRGTIVNHFHARNVYAEATWVANKILELKQSKSNYAILYRSNSTSRVIEEKLIENGIPYEVLSGISFYARKEVKDVLSVLSLVAFGDDLAFNRVIKTLSLGLGAKKIEALKALTGDKTSLYQALRQNFDVKPFKTTKAGFLVNLVEDLRAYSEKETISMLMGRIYTALDLEQMYLKNGETERWENLQELKRSAQHYEHSQSEKVDLADYLGSLALYTSSDKPDKDNTVKLMTIHGAKGLEFPVVFVVGMNEGLMPSSRTATAEDLEEERRVAYVALTRAKDYLFMTDAEGENFDKSYRLPSRFLFNINRELYKTEGRMDDYLISQTQAKMDADAKKMDKPTSNILNSIKDRVVKKDSKVRHEVFGEGVVMQVTNDAFVILFDHYGLKGIKKDSTKIELISN